jgi:putative ABC transport system substrate-binding protein
MIQRREFITLLGGSALTWPLAAPAQQPAMPVIGYLNGLAVGDRPHLLAGFHRGLTEAGYVAGQNVAIEYRFAENQPDRLQALASDLIARRVAVIVATGGNNVVRVAKSLTTTIPIVFTSGSDPVRAGLVGSISRPEANVTGVSWFTDELGPKHLEIVRELVPEASLVGVLVNSRTPESDFYQQPIREVAARTPGLRVEILDAGTPGDIDRAFEKAVQMKASAIVAAGEPFFSARATQIVVLMARNNIPMVSTNRDFPTAGGLISYGNDIADAYRRLGAHVGRILKGAKPADLPIDRATKFELVINLQTAKTFKIEIPPKLLALADEVIE